MTHSMAGQASAANLLDTYQVADIEADGDLARVVAELQGLPAASPTVD